MRIIVPKIIPFLLLTIIGCYTAPKHPTPKEHQKDYFDYYNEYGYPVASRDTTFYLSYISWQNQQRLPYWARYYNPVYRNHYPYYDSHVYYSHNYHHRPVEKQNTKIIVYKEMPKKNYIVERKVWEKRQNTSRISRPSKMKPKPLTQQELIARQQAKQAVERKVIKKKKPLTQQEWIAKQQAEMKKDNE